MSFEGTYYVNSDYSFKAVLENKYYNTPPNPMVLFVMEGGIKIYIRSLKYYFVMNGYTNEGYGDYDMDCTIYLQNGTTINDIKFHGDWELSRQYFK